MTRVHLDCSARPLAISIAFVLALATACAGDDGDSAGETLADEAPTTIQTATTVDVPTTDEPPTTDEAPTTIETPTTSETTTSDGTPTEPEPDNGVDHAGDRFVTTALAELPGGLIGSGSMAELRVGDLDAATEAADLQRPDRDDHGAVATWLGPITGGPVTLDDGSPGMLPVFVPLPALFHPGWFGSLDEVDDELGWTPLDVAWFAEYSVPPNVVTVLGGDFPVERLDAAMGAPVDGTWMLGGDDGEVDLAGRTTARSLGESLRLVGGDDRLAVARTTPLANAAVNPTASGGTAADHPIVAQLATGLDSTGAYAATLLIGGAFAGLPDLGNLDEGTLTEVEARLLPAPFVGIAGGAAVVDGEPFGVIVYAHLDQASAEENAAALEQMLAEGESLASGRPWTDLFSAFDVAVDGLTVVARVAPVEGRSPRDVYDAILRRETIASHR